METSGKQLVRPPSAPGEPKNQVVGYVILVFLFTWVLFGVIALVFSLVCFGYSGSAIEKILGLLLALFMGPFYFLYYFGSGSYCKALPPTF